MKNSFYDEHELKLLGLKSIGKNVLISRNANLYGTKNISIADNVRIDDHCVISAGDNEIKIGSYVHIACFSCIFGQGGVELEDFTCISSRVAIYSINDDYLGGVMTNPTVPMEYRKVKEAKVILKKHSLIGTGSTILPGVIIEEGVSVGAMSLVNKSLKEWGVYVGIPAKYLCERDKNILNLEKQLLIKYN